MDSYIQYIKQALPNLSIHSYKQNEEGWDNIAVIINNEIELSKGVKQLKAILQGRV